MDFMTISTTSQGTVVFEGWSMWIAAIVIVLAAVKAIELVQYWWHGNERRNQHDK